MCFHGGPDISSKECFGFFISSVLKFHYVCTYMCVLFSRSFSVQLDSSYKSCTHFLGLFPLYFETTFCILEPSYVQLFSPTNSFLISVLFLAHILSSCIYLFAYSCCPSISSTLSVASFFVGTIWCHVDYSTHR